MHPGTMSPLETCPKEVLEKIVLTLVYDIFLGPPTGLLSILLVSKTIYSKLSITNNPWLYSQIFMFKFDYRAMLRRLDTHEARTKMFSKCLVKRFLSLARLRHAICHAFVTAPTALDDLWTVYTMFLENDHCNASQLIYYARVDRFAFNFISHGGPFHDGTEENGGWKVDNEMNALAAWLFWFTDKDRVARETPAARQRILEAVAHVFVGSFKYASTHAPITSFCIPPIVMPLTSTTMHALPLSAMPVSQPSSFKDIVNPEMMLTHPLLTPAILLICVVRLEAASGEMSLRLPAHIPGNRQEALLLGWDGPTVEDYQDQIRPTTKFEELGGGQDSERHEHDWVRLRTCFSPWSQPRFRCCIFTPGMLDGTWAGRAFSVPPDQFISMIDPNALLAEPPQLQVYPRSLQFRLREHHRRDPYMTFFNDTSHESMGEGVLNAWLPKGTVIKETLGKLEVKIPNMSPLTYETYDGAGAAQGVLDTESLQANVDSGVYGQGVYDILLTARTDESFGRFWGYKQYYGRVRSWDGLVVLVSVPAQHESSVMFYGYVQGNQNLIGRWRETDTPIDIPGWEGVWSMSKVN